MSRAGARRMVPFQAAYSGGRTTDASEGPEILVEELSIIPTASWESGPSPVSWIRDRVIATDISRLVRTIAAAHATGGAAPASQSVAAGAAGTGQP